MIAPISSLSNMEMQLYGGKNFGTSVPSYTNNYCGSSTFNNTFCANPYYGTYNAGMTMPSNTNFGQTIPQNYSNQYAQYASNISKQPSVNQNVAQPKTIFQGLTQSEQKALVNTYKKGLEPPEQLALGSGVAMQAIMMNPRVIAHPKNTLKTFFKAGSDTNKMFEAVKKGGKLTELWKDNAYIMEEAFAQMHRTECRSMDKWGWFRKQYTAKGSS